MLEAILHIKNEKYTDTYIFYNFSNTFLAYQKHYIIKS